MKPYSAYSAEELALDDLFVRWVKHPHDAEVTAFWQGWLAQHPYCQETVDTARLLVLNVSSGPLHRLAPDDVSSLWGRIRESLQDMEDVRPLQPEVRSFIGWWYFVRTVAAVAGLILFVGWALWMQYDQPMQTIHTQAAESRSVLLPDGSRVILRENSELRYARQWANETPRAVWLRGEADFTVVHRTGHPAACETFRVHTSNLTVEALGTSFRVCQRPLSTRVALASGRVNLLLDNQHPISLQPGESVEITPDQRTIRSH